MRYKTGHFSRRRDVDMDVDKVLSMSLELSIVNQNMFFNKRGSKDTQLASRFNRSEPNLIL